MVPLDFWSESAVRIVKYPHPTLRYKSKPVRRVDGELRKMIHQMYDLMYTHEGIGLAANQVDLPYRLFVMNIKSDSTAKEEEHAFINPVILQRKGGMEEKDEGCLSLPDVHGPVKRPRKIVLNAYNLAGEEVTWEMDGMYARVVQHECDHLDGILFVDRLSEANLLAVKEALQDMEAAFSGERQRGLIPDDQLIVARLSELETART
jgi:peptide deformylase